MTLPPHAPRWLAPLALLFASHAPGAEPTRDAQVREAVDAAVRPLLAQYGIPGAAIAITIDGQRYFVDYGMASNEPQVPVTRDTLFELGSISKTFTATLAAYAEAQGKLSLNDRIGARLPELKGSALDQVRLLDLATHTAGGFPLQVPDEVKSQEQLMAYFRAWKPQFPPRTHRTYANPSIGLLGIIAARSLGARFQTLMEQRLFPELGLRRTFIKVPDGAMPTYAWGHDRNDKPIRVTPGLLDSEAYGVKSSAADMIRYLEVSMGIGRVPAKLARALQATHTGYFHAGEVIQDLIWEQYPFPAAVEKMVAGNSPRMALNSIPATAIDPPMAPRADVILNKTGSTNGFGAYVAFIPARRIGIVILANKSYPNEARVRAAHSVLSRMLSAVTPPKR